MLPYVEYSVTKMSQPIILLVYNEILENYVNMFLQQQYIVTQIMYHEEEVVVTVYGKHERIPHMILMDKQNQELF